MFINEVVCINLRGVEGVWFLFMGLIVLELMVDLEDVRKVVFEVESFVVELWEMVDLKVNMKKLLLIF